MMHEHTQSRQGMIFLFMLGLITVLLVIAFSFVTNMQMVRRSSLTVRHGELARRAAEMGMQHAIAVCLHEYAMADEVQDGVTQAALSRIDAPHKNIFTIMSPRLAIQERDQQPPQPYDLAPDVSFQDLFNNFIDGTYHGYDHTGARDVTITGFDGGWTMNRGYGRFFEPNRFDYRSGVVYDPSTYDAYDPAMPIPGAVQTPFPPVVPFSQASTLTRVHALDNPLWYDADLAPVDPATALGSSTVRYRMRYAVNVQDQSGSLWLNTDMPWLTEVEKSEVRQVYQEPIAAVGTQMGIDITYYGSGFFVDYGISFASVFLGYGQYGNSRFSSGGIPLDWPSRGGAPMAYRGPLANSRALHCVHGSPYMHWNDPVDGSAPGGRRWLGSALSSWNDLAFALQDHHTSWQDAGETMPTASLIRKIPVRGDRFAQRAGTPFGRPSGGATHHPWAVNVLVTPMRVLQGMIAAYVPPVARSLTYTPAAATASAYALGRGPDLFTQAYAPEGKVPFPYPTPANRDYWTSPATARPNHTSPMDTRSLDQRYPGARFFSYSATEPEAQRCTLWSDLSTNPLQVASESMPLLVASQSIQILPDRPEGLDHLGRHIVFYNPLAQHMVIKSKNGYYSAYHEPTADNRVYPKYTAVAWHKFFTPASPFGRDYSSTMGHHYRHWQATGGPCLNLYQMTRDRKAYEGSLDRGISGPNSYWNRVSLAFAHAVVVAQVANLAWADPQDPRTQSFPIAPTYSAPYGDDKPATGVLYHALTPASAPTALVRTRKGPTSTWDPAAADFATIEQIDRQFVANLGESFDAPGTLAPSQALSVIDPSTGRPRPPRFSHCLSDAVNKEPSTANYRFIQDYKEDPSSASFGYGSYLSVGEYRVTNNIRTLLTPIDLSLPGATLTPRSTDELVGANIPPRNLWLLDEWNAENDASYVPGTTVGLHPTPVARARAKLMERVLNDWRLSFLGSARSYADHFRPKDFDGDGLVFCSGYIDSANMADSDTGLICWQLADADGNGPGNGAVVGDPARADPTRMLTIFSVTGTLAFQRSQQYKIQVRGELFDNVLGSAVAEQYLESALLVDPDGNVTRSGAATGIADSTIMMQRPIHNYYRGYLSRAYP